MNRKPSTINPKIFEKIKELVGAEETTEDLWKIFDDLMMGYDEDYMDYSVGQVGYLFLIFAFGYCYGVDDMPRIVFEDDDLDGLH
jgi:hypothetical protein